MLPVYVPMKYKLLTTLVPVSFLEKEAEEVEKSFTIRVAINITTLLAHSLR